MIAVAQGNEKKVNEKQLFHGTSPETVEAICKQNFDWRLHGKNATMYGEGSYFAVNASYSDKYAKRDSNLSQFMFLAKVLVGSYTEGRSGYRRPPPKNRSNPASDLYDSCVDDEYYPSIFVVFDTDQFYPEYIIKYSTASSYFSHFTSQQPIRRAPPSNPRPPKSHFSRSSVGSQWHPSRPSSHHGATSTSRASAARGGHASGLSRSRASGSTTSRPSHARFGSVGSMGWSDDPPTSRNRPSQSFASNLADEILFGNSSANSKEECVIL